MDKNLTEEEVRKKRIVLVGEYFLKTGESTRKISEYFTKNFFHISNYTVHEYIIKYAKMNPKNKEAIDKLIYELKANSIKKPNVARRVLLVADLLKEGFTLNEISEKLKEDYWTIYRDANVRLFKLDPVKQKEVREILKNNSLNNLNNRQVK